MNTDNLGSCLITGSGGFVGSRLTEYLGQHFVDLTSLGRENSHDIKHFNCDYLKESIPLNSLQGIDTVFHLAGLAHDTNNKSAEKEYKRINSEFTLELAKLALKSNVKRFIYLSSVKVSNIEGVSHKKYIDIYARSKLEAEQLLQEACLHSPMSVKILRSSLVYGPGMKGNLEKLQTAIGKGWFPKLTLESNKRSMIHVDDLVRALVFISNKDFEKKYLEVSDGLSYSSKNIYDRVAQSTEVTGKFLRLPEVLFTILKKIPYLNNSFDKIYGDDYHECFDIFNLGFKPKLRLNNLNETIF